MILDNWIECTAGDHKYSRKHVDFESESTEDDTEQWYRIYDGYIEKYGLSDHYNRILKAMKKKALLEIKYVQTRDQFLITLIGIEEEKLKILFQSVGTGMSIEKSLIHLSRWCGYQIKSNQTTVVEYFNILAEYGRSSKTA